MSRKSRRRKASARGEITFQIEEERPTRAFVLHVDFKSDALRRAVTRDKNSPPPSSARRDAARMMDEALSLAAAIDLDIAGHEIVTLSKLNPATLMGPGKAKELKGAIHAADAELVIVNTHLSPGQQRNLEKAWDAKVLDRTGLILEIFGRRARTKEGRLQVELAHLNYQKTRLVRSWTHLERQRGGFGFMGGPGETQIEADRRLLSERIGKLTRQLEQVARTRALHRKARRKVPYPVVALAGYTNAGKSTLFNRLASAHVHARDQLFATLDPTMRLIDLPHGRKVILSDTVGFISDLPTTLVAAFRATLEEVLEADLILHVRDMTDEDEADAQARDVEHVLRELGLDEARLASMIEVWNKADQWSDETRRRLTARAAREERAVITSAVTGEGLDDLLEGIEAALSREDETRIITLPPQAGADLAWLYRHADVLQRQDAEDGTRLTVRFAPAGLARAESRFGARLRHSSSESPASRSSTK